MKSSPFTSLTFNDKRISARANLTLSKMIATGNSVINRIFGNFADKIATYRMFNNPKVTMESIVSAYADACKARMAESHCTHVLCLQDTCEINYNGHNLRMHKRGKLQAVSLMVRQAVSSILHLQLIRRPLLLMASLIYICGTVKREIPDAVSANTRNCRRS